MNQVWQDYVRPPKEPLRGMTRLTDRIEFLSLESIRKTRGVSRLNLSNKIGIHPATYYTWRNRGWCPLWAVKRANRIKKQSRPHIDKIIGKITRWKHQILLAGQSYKLFPKENELKKARRAAFMFAIRHNYRISVRTIRGKRITVLVIRVR